MNKKLIGIIGAGAAAGGTHPGCCDDGNRRRRQHPRSCQHQPTRRARTRRGREPLTGANADKVTAAAERGIPDGTVTRVETDSDGVYEAHVTKADGTEVIVQVGADFSVTGVQEMMGRGMGGHRADRAWVRPR